MFSKNTSEKLIVSERQRFLTSLFSYTNDRRKQKAEVRNLYHGKKVEIGENFYFMNGELMTMIRKNISYWKSKDKTRGPSSIGFVNREMEKLDSYQVKLHAKNWNN
jgi:hypothetical protein